MLLAFEIDVNWFFFPLFQHAMLHLEIHHPFRPIIYIRYFFPQLPSDRYSDEWKINLRHFMANLLTHFSFFHFTSFRTVYDFSIPLRHFQLIKKYVFSSFSKTQKISCRFSFPFHLRERWDCEGWKPIWRSNYANLFSFIEIHALGS